MTAASVVTGERLQKLIAAAGITSRRKAEGLIAAGRVMVNGEVVTDLGTRADLAKDRVLVDGQPIAAERKVWIVLHKPRGVVTSVEDPHAQQVVTDLVRGVGARIYPAGRLDLQSEGLVLMTNDGELMHAMTRPGGPVRKVYDVTVEGRPHPRDLERLRAGIELGDVALLPCKIKPMGAARNRFEVILHEGKNNQIRRMFSSIGHPVSRLVRTRIGELGLGNLRPGEWRELDAGEVARLRRLAGLAAAPPEAKT